MNLKRLLFVCVLGLLWVPSVNGHESIRLRFQVTRNGAVLANPQVAVDEASVGWIEIDDTLSLAFTPRVQNSRLTLTFDIRTDGKQLQPQLALDTTEPAAISWTTAGGESIKITVVAIR